MFSGVGCSRKTAVAAAAAEGRRAAAEQVPWEQVRESTVLESAAAAAFVAFVAAVVSRSLQPGYKSVHFFIRSRLLTRSLIH
jgi:hypothetical protein